MAKKWLAKKTKKWQKEKNYLSLAISKISFNATIKAAGATKTERLLSIETKYAPTNGINATPLVAFWVSINAMAAIRKFVDSLPLMLRNPTKKPRISNASGTYD
jgi:hypothetical protein